MDSDDPSKLGLAEKSKKTGKPACRVFVFALPHSRRECTRACFSASVLIRVISGLKFFFPVAAALGRFDRIMDDRIIFWGEFNHGFLGWTRMIPAGCDWQKKVKKRASLLAEFLFSPCPIRAANAPVLVSLHPCSSG
jgi:hypothetical protein